jgi:hypothetical protein
MTRFNRPVEIPSIEEWLADRSLAGQGLAIFQNVYSDPVIGWLDPHFLPIEGRHNARTESREIGLFLRAFHTGLYRRAPLTGIVSPKFDQKTAITGEMFIDFIKSNPGYNVYFINPMPQNIYYSLNVWHHGEICHPGLMALSEILFYNAGFDPNVFLQSRDNGKTALYCSYWVGDEKFWNGYLCMVIRLLNALRALPNRLAHKYFVRDREYPDPVPIMPFIFERSFSAYLHLNNGIKALPYPFSRHEILMRANHFEQEIVATFGDVVDDIDRKGRYTLQDRALFDALARFRAKVSRRFGI